MRLVTPSHDVGQPEVDYLYRYGVVCHQEVIGDVQVFFRIDFNTGTIIFTRILNRLDKHPVVKHHSFVTVLEWNETFRKRDFYSTFHHFTATAQALGDVRQLFAYNAVMSDENLSIDYLTPSVQKRL
ncbi:hypothetical protein D3C81_925170 [compost metagenome]